MEFWNTAVIVLAVVLLAFGGEWLVIRFFQIDKQARWVYKRVNQCHRTGEVILVFIYCLFLLFNFRFIYWPITYLMFGFIIMLNLFRAVMEWKYIRETKRYILSMYAVCFCLLFLVWMNIF
ncbi:DUF4181 domain-containing protein [Bacillus sp. FJAT-42376]|uniref:DUF4181 domain-containing protein n=1 Tax=Bacillus sp. FJAT-42376 TaxID=2014076 RepID=UPI000F4FF401|nr:DUF4181 domain-containing protein [Bacillus sp. FJAT-42376]AZB41991.1 DUF4181 domain-containing protein [Bacillus sp. FJAT-42376]